MILVCGEALIDLFVGPAAGAEMPVRAVAGGYPFNIAVGLARLGVDVSFLGGISRDRFGALLARMLVREGVDDRFLVRTDRLSTISMVATDDDGQPSYAFHGEGAAGRSLALAQLAKTDRLSPDAIAELDLSAIRDLLGYAMAAAAVTISRNGANLPTVADVEASLSAADLATEISEIDLRKGFA